jgi:hypothetical protein
MRVKAKICKYSLCGLEFIPVRMGQKTCLNAESGYECARGYAAELKAKESQEETKELVKAYRENAKSLSDYKDDLQDLVNKIVRLIDKGHPSMSDNLTNYEVHAGHLISRGNDDTLRFHLFNIWAQSSSDNMYNGGNSTGMRENIKRLFGQEIINLIDGLKAKYPVIKLSKADIVEIKLVASKIIRELEGADKIYTNAERIELRHKINARLNIYQNG